MISYIYSYVCDICGYVYDPAYGVPGLDIEPGTPFENLPIDFVCPGCGATIDHFYEVDKTVK
ncbi:MAG: rubredoxin [Chlamydiota bacterium]